MRRAMAIALVSTVARAVLAHRYFGFAIGDDAEIVQEAFRAAFGLDYMPWRIRSLVASELLVAPVLWVGYLLGLHDPAGLATLARYPFVVLGGVNVVLVFLVGRRWFDERVGLLASALYAVHWIPLVFGSSTFVRVFATTCVLLALLLVKRPLHWNGFLAGVLLACAFAIRFSEGIFLVALLLLVPGVRDKVRLTAGFLAGALILVGGYDWLRWGQPFLSLIEFTKLTLVERLSSSLEKQQPLWWYLQTLPQWLTPALWPFLASAWSTSRRRIVAMLIVPVLLLSLIHHKELRYLQAIIPFAMLFAAAGALRWWDAGRRKLVIALLVIAFPFQLGRIRSVERRSMAAVAAVQSMRDRGVRAVALSQVWAYGGRVYLGNEVKVFDLQAPPQAANLREHAPQVDCAAMYRSELTGELRAIAAGAGLTHAQTFQRDRSRPVVVLCR